MLRAVLFDFNGVILNDEPVHMAMFQQVFNEEGLMLSQEDYYAHYLGMDDKGCIKAFYKANGKKIPDKKLNLLIRKKSELYDRYIIDHVEFFPGSVKLVKEAKKKYFTAIVSGALKHEIEFGLKESGLEKSIDAIVAQEDVAQGKPNPEGYIRALDAINQTLQKDENPLMGAECLVIEDSLEGIHAAKEAGMRVAAVAHSYPAEILTPEADWVFEKVGDISLPEIEKHF